MHGRSRLSDQRIAQRRPGDAAQARLAGQLLLSQRQRAEHLIQPELHDEVLVGLGMKLPAVGLRVGLCGAYRVRDGYRGLSMTVFIERFSIRTPQSQ